MPYIIVRKNNVGIYDINESIDTRIYMTEGEALNALDRKQKQYGEKLTIAGEG